MRITISLDTQAVITQPSPARAKAGGFVPVEVAFTRGTQSVMLPAGSTLEFVLKPKNTWTGGVLVYHATFASAAGSLYVGVANFATAELLAALGLTDNAPANDVSQIEAAAEVVWNIAGQRFRSSTFSVVVEAPLLDTTITPPADPTLYPTPGELQAILATKSDVGHGHQASEITFETQAPGTGDEWSPVDGNEVAARANGAFHSVNFLWNDHNDLHSRASGHIGGTGDRHDLSHIDGLAEALAGPIQKNGPAQTVSSPLHLTSDLTIAGKSISGTSGVFFDDARPAVKGTLSDVGAGRVAVFDGTAGNALRSHVPVPVPGLSTSATPAEIVARFNDLLSALRTLGIIA